MSVEGRLRSALHEADTFEPSVDLFARVELSLDEDRRRRRRRMVTVGATTALVLALVGYLIWAVESDGDELVVTGWKIVIAEMVVAACIVLALGPNIRRFARSFVDDVFHLSPGTGARFLAVLDVAYYVAFTGLVLIDADQWGLTSQKTLAGALDQSVDRLASLLLAMGVLHALNIAVLPVIGLVFNSIARRDLRRRAGPGAPHESSRARAMDSNARGFAIAAVVVVFALLVGLILGPLGGIVVGRLP